MINTNDPEQPSVGVTVALVLGPIFAIWVLLVLTSPIELVSAVEALGLVVIPVLVVAATTSEATAWSWARTRGVEFDRSVGPQLRRYLLHVRVARTVGVMLGFATNVMLMAHYNADPRAFRWFVDGWSAEIDGLWLSGLGYAVATIWTELAKPRWLTGKGGGVAVLAPRRLRDFADASLLRWLAPAMLAVPVAAAIWTSAPPPSQPVSNRLKEGVLLGSGVVAVGALVAAVLVCRRSERSASDTAVAYEELTRSASVNALLGLSTAMFGQVAAELIGSQVVIEWLSGWVVTPMLLLVGVAPVVAWGASGTSLVFRSRRMDLLRMHSLGASA